MGATLHVGHCIVEAELPPLARVIDALHDARAEIFAPEPVALHHGNRFVSLKIALNDFDEPLELILVVREVVEIFRVKPVSAIERRESVNRHINPQIGAVQLLGSYDMHIIRDLIVDLGKIKLGVKILNLGKLDNLRRIKPRLERGLQGGTGIR